MAGIAFEVETLDGVEQSLQAAYEESEGKFIFNPDKYAEIKGAGVKKNAADLKKEKDRLKGEFESFKAKFADLTDDALAEFKAWQEKKASGETDPPKKDDDPGDKSATPEEIRSRLKTAHEAELRRKEAELKAQIKAAQAEKDKEIAAIQAKHQAFVKRTKLMELADETDVIPERRKLWLKEAESRYGLDESGELVVLDEDGEPDTDIKPDKYSRETLRSEFDYLYAAKEQGGSGSGGSKTATSSTGLKRSKMTNEQKAKYIREHGAAGYQRLPI